MASASSLTRRAPRWSRLFLHRVLLVAAGMCLAWGAGFAWFLHLTASGPPPQAADGIVVLTGGAERIETALRLLASGQARLLLISGVGGAASFPDFSRRAGVDAALGPRVTIGRAATDTRGNAAETAAWARDNRLSSLLVVTAAYHMPRALAELRRAAPDLALHPVPVVSAVQRSGLPALRLLATEYVKWLGAVVRLSGIYRHSEATTAARSFAGPHRG